jgi:hypothetical protein
VQRILFLSGGEIVRTCASFHFHHRVSLTSAIIFDMLLYLSPNTAAPIKGPTSQPAAPQAKVMMPIVKIGSRPISGPTFDSIPGVDPIYMAPPANAPMEHVMEANRLILRLDLRSFKNRFHVRAWWLVVDVSSGDD